MKDRFERIIYLIKRSRRQLLSDPEKEELEVLLKSPVFQQVCHEWKDKNEIRQRLLSYSRYSSVRAFAAFKERSRDSRSRTGVILRWSGVAAAVGCVLGAYLLFRADDITPPPPSQEIASGGKRAFLKLTNGDTVCIENDAATIYERHGTVINYHDGALSYPNQKNITELVYNELIVPRAGESQLILADGTKVWLNSESKLTYPIVFAGEERKIVLEGEAFFEVAKDRKPFIVSTWLGEVRVLGTSFDIKAYREEEKVFTTLVAGKVCFSGSQTVEITPGEQVIAFSTGEVKKRSVNVAEYMGWKNGLFVFENQRLEEIMTTLSRWYDVTVEYQDERLKEIEFTGDLKRYDHINRFMNVITTTGEVKYTITGNHITLHK